MISKSRVRSIHSSLSIEANSLSLYAVENIIQFLKDNKFDDEHCFSHGDTSLPNIFASGNEFVGFIDVGECGIADKWFDLAICEKSIRRNYG